MSFCGFIKEISPKICILCVRVKINKRSFEPFCVWILCQVVLTQCSSVVVVVVAVVVVGGGSGFYFSV